MSDELAFLHGEGIVCIDRETAPVTIAGTSRKDKRRLAALQARRNWLAVKLQDVPRSRLNYEHHELRSLEWALEIIQLYFDHLNTSDCDLAETDIADLYG